MDTEERQETRYMPKKRLSVSYLLAAAVLIATFFGGVYLGSQTSEAGNLVILNGTTNAPPTDVDLAPLWKAWQLLEEKYVPATTSDAVSNKELVYGAITGLVEALGDPYTVFLPPQESEIFNEDISGNFEGVGMEIGVRGGALVVIAPLQGTPAARAGVQSGDRIREIDGEPTEGMTVDEAVQRIRGERGTTVELTIAREGEEELLTIPIVRDVIAIPTIETLVEEGGPGIGDDVFVIRIFNFSATSPGLFRGALREFVERKGDKLILDVRGNPGGFLEAAVDIASWFLPTGSVVVAEDFGDDEESRVHRSKGYDIFNENLKMVVLIDRGSASASEILAGALSEHGIATLVGERTFGKGSVQELVDVTSDTSLKVTVARWLTPNGTSISDGGLAPDINVSVDEEDALSGRDPQLERALEYLRQ